MVMGTPSTVPVQSKALALQVHLLRLGNAKDCREAIEQKPPLRGPGPTTGQSTAETEAVEAGSRRPLLTRTHSYWSATITVRRTMALVIWPSHASFSEAESATR